MECQRCPSRMTPACAAARFNSPSSPWTESNNNGRDRDEPVELARCPRHIRAELRTWFWMLVRTRFTAGGEWVRTFGSARDPSTGGVSVAALPGRSAPARFDLGVEH